MSLTDVLIALAFIALGVFAARLLEAAQGPRRRALQQRVPPALLLAIAAIGAYVLFDAAPDGATKPEEAAYYAQAIAGVCLAGVICLLWAAGPARAFATRSFQHTARPTIPVGGEVDATVAALPGSDGKFAESHVATEDITYTRGTTANRVTKGETVPTDVADDAANKDKVALRRTATEPIPYGEATTTEYQRHQEIGDDGVAEAHHQEVDYRLAFPLRGAWTGKDGRWSTSKITVLLWTLTVVWALIAFVLATQALDVALTVPKEEGPVGKGLGDVDLPDEYYLLLGGPFAAAVLARAFTSAKVEEGTLVKTEEVKTKVSPVDGLAEVLNDDYGDNDLVDSQYFLFNLIALGVFYVIFLGALREGMPEIPEVIFGLTSASALAYTAKKAIERTVVTISGASATTVRPGATIRVWGQNLVPPDLTMPAVTVGGRPATVQPGGGPPAAGGRRPSTAADELSIVIPADTPSGEAQIVATPRGGGASNAFAITVEGVTISAVTPEPIPLRAGQRIVVTGEGFGDTGTVSLGGRPLRDAVWTPTSVVATLDLDQKYPVAADAAVLEVATEGQTASRSTKVEGLTITRIDPAAGVKAVAGERLVVAGTGFASLGVTATVAGRPVDIESPSDVQLVLRLKEGETYAPADAAPVVLASPLGYAAQSQVKLIAP